MARRLALLFALWLGLTHCAGQTGTPTAASAPCVPFDPERPAYDGTRGKDLWTVFEGRRQLTVAWRAQDDAGVREDHELGLTLTITRIALADAMPGECASGAPVAVQIDTDDGSLEASARTWLIGTADHARINLLDAPVERPVDHRIAGVIELRPDETEVSLRLDPGGMTLESLGDAPSD